MIEAADLELFLDESGGFEEADPGSRSTQKFPSQLAGILAPRGELTSEAAHAILADAHASAGLSVGDEVHGTALSRGEHLDALLTRVVRAILARGWQPVRLANEEQVTWGDRVATYTAMVAELAIRVVELQTARGRPPRSLEVVGAVVKLGEDEYGRPDLLEVEDYKRRLAEQWVFAGIRRGAPRLASQVTLSVRLGSGRTWPELQLCDLLSNGSHDRFKKCGDAVRALLGRAFGDYDQTLVLRSTAFRVDGYLREGSIGLAVRSMLEARAELEAKGPEAERLRSRLSEAIAALARIDAPWRTVQLQALTSWCEQVVEQSRMLETGAEMVHWLLARVEGPLRARLGDAAWTIDWYAYALHRLALTAANHRGALGDAAAAYAALQSLVPRLAGHWEHATLLVQGFIAQAVHDTDAWQPDQAASRMELVARYYADLASIVSDAMPGVFPQRVRSELRGQALGTWLQAETFVALRDPARIARARRISDDAIDEFEAPSDKQRQYQYRAHLEVVARDFAAARSFLARSLELGDTTHAAIASHLAGLPHARLGFPLLHWLRLGAACCLDGTPDERTALLDALDASRLAEGEWVQAAPSTYPAHGIRRHLAVIHASRSQTGDALRVLERLRAIVPSGNKPSVFVLLQATAQLEVAALLLDAEPDHARRLLDNADRDRPGVRQLVTRLERVEHLARAVAGWSAALEHHAGRDRLLALARAVPY